MNTTHLDGYGASIEYDGHTVTIIAGKVQAKIWRTDRVTFPAGDILKIDYRAANPLINGSMVFTTSHAATTYAKAGAFVPDNGLIIHWRRKDQAAFADLHRMLDTGSVSLAHLEDAAQVRKTDQAAFLETKRTN